MRRRDCAWNKQQIGDHDEHDVMTSVFSRVKGIRTLFSLSLVPVLLRSYATSRYTQKVKGNDDKHEKGLESNQRFLARQHSTASSADLLQLLLLSCRSCPVVVDLISFSFVTFLFDAETYTRFECLTSNLVYTHERE
jgi:hypothetical protein